MPAPEIFGTATRPSRWRFFAASFVVQTVALSALVASGIISPDVIGRNHELVTLVAPPPPVAQTPQRVRREFELKTPTVPIEKPMMPRVVAPVKIEPPHLHIADVPKAPALPPVRGGRLTPPVQTNVFSSGSSAPQTTKLLAPQVQTGGFGDPNGVPPNATSQGKPSIASVGSFDLPRGPGEGNGTGGNRGVRGVVASAGFGNGVAVPGDGSGGRGRGEVRAGGFGDNAQPAPSAPKRVQASVPVETPVQVLWKPKPVYTDEARNLHIEGEVVLQVTFSASGEVRVLNVIRGLGHGLDESAERAAQQIRFKPAQRNGQAVDATATIHIVFELA